MSLFEVVQSGEKSVEILSKVQHLLTDLNNVFLFRFGRLNQLMHNLGRNQSVPLELLTNLESHVEGANCDETGLLAAQLIIMHRHFPQIHRHFENQELQPFGGVWVFRDRFLLFFGQRSLSLVTNVENFLQVDAKEVKDGRGGNLVVDCL